MTLSHLIATACLTACLGAQDVYWHAEGLSGDRLTRGFEVARFADIDGDGWEDLLENVGGTQIGGGGTAIWVTSGRDGHMISSHVIPFGDSLYFYSMTAIGDMDQDGVPDYSITIGPFLHIEVRSGLDHHLILTLPSPPGITHFGFSVAGVDLNGDGRCDLVVAADRLSPHGTVIAYDSSGTELYRIVDPRPDLLVAVDLVPLGGDLDGDGGQDFLMACPDNTGRGAICVVSGRTGTILRTSYGESPGDGLYFATGCGDLDGDGVPDYAGGGTFGNGVVRTFSGATGQALHTYRTFQGYMGTDLKSGFDLDQDGVNDILAGAPGDYVHVLSGRDGTFLYSFRGSRYPSGTCTGNNVAMLAPPPGDPYPLLVYSEYCWWNPSDPTVNSKLWAVRGAPPRVQAYGNGTASAGESVPRMGMRDLPGDRVRFSLSSAQPGAIALLALGWSDQSFRGSALPLTLTGFGLPGITLRTSTDALMFAQVQANGVDAGYVGLDIPMPLAATGTALHAQWLWLDPQDPTVHGSTAGHRFLVR